MGRTTTHKQVFRRASLWYSLIGWGAILSGGWILYRNVQLTRIGLFAEGWRAIDVDAIALGMAALESAVSIFATQPENWDDIWINLEDMGTGGKSQMPLVVKLIFSAILVGFIATACIGAYCFDFYSTHGGLYPGQVIVGKSALFSLGFNFGTELLAFFGFQCLRSAKRVKREELLERLEVEPANRYNQKLLQHRNHFAEQQAEDDIKDERAAYRHQRSNVNQNGYRR